MKKATKQEFITLLEKVFSDADFDLGELQGYLNELLKKYSKQSCHYLIAIKEFDYKLRVYIENTNPEYNHSERVYQDAQRVLDILNTPLRELEEQEAAKQRQLELEIYHKELPLKLLQLMADTLITSILSHVDKDEKGLYTCFRIPYYSSDDYIRGYDEYLVYLNGHPSEYNYAVRLIEAHYEKIKEAQQKADLVKAAKAKLTDEEKKLLGL